VVIVVMVEGHRSSPSPTQAGSSSLHHLYQVDYVVPADTMLLRDAGRMPAAPSGAKKKNPPKQVVTSGLDFFLTCT
jgi:hypothetical protein